MLNSNVYIERLNLIRSEHAFRAAFCFSFFSSRDNYEDLIKCLSTEERDYFNTLSFEKRINSYLLGRYVAKQAVAVLTGEDRLSNIIIQKGIFTQPIVVTDKNIQVSITHCNNLGAAIAFPEAHPMGIDIEEINENKRNILEAQITKFEKEKVNFIPITYDMWLTLLWTAKEALSKVLKTGLMTPFEIYEIYKYELYDNFIICYYRNFPQYKVISFNIGSYMCSIVYPLKSQLVFNIIPFKKYYLCKYCNR